MNGKSAVEAIRRILNPKNVVVVGASNNPDKWGYKIIQNLLKGNYNGKIYAVNKREEVLGLPTYRSVFDIPEKIDLLVLTVSGKDVPDVLRQGICRRARGAVVLSAGFREAGNDALEKELEEIISSGDIRIIGPNIQGINCTYSNLCIAPHPFLTRRGPIGIISQSGSVSATIAEWAELEGIGFSSMVNLGNQNDLCESDFLEYFAEDPLTKVIVLYLEGPKDSNLFASTIKRVAVKKPVVLLKPGRTTEGCSAALSHTASIAGNDEVFTAACRQFGVIRANEVEEVFDVAKTLGLLSLTKGNKIGLGTTSGGTITLFIDEAVKHGLCFIAPPEEAVAELKSCPYLTSNVSGVSKYLDVMASTSETWKRVLRIMAKHPYADLYNIIIADPRPGVEEAIIEYARSLSEPVAATYMGGGEAERIGRYRMQEAGIPCYPTPERAARGLASLVWYSEYKRRVEYAG